MAENNVNENKNDGQEVDTENKNIYINEDGTVEETATIEQDSDEGETTEETAEMPQKETAEKQKPFGKKGDKKKSAEPSPLEKELATTKQTLLRTAAEYDNFRKRTAREKDAAFGNGVSFAAEKLLTVLDTLAIAAVTETADEKYKQGVVMTLDKANEAFCELGICEIEAMGKEFDPETMAAVMQQPAAEGQNPNEVVNVFQKGYTLHDKVIRHASVVVAV
ncbi:MAG: nucleotide exchange factor GrpE [Oscillospiraceae bacterium]